MTRVEEVILTPAVFGKMIGDMRRALKLPLKTIAERAGIDVTLLQAYELGREDPTLTHIVNIADALGTGASIVLVNSVRAVHRPAAKKKRRPGLR